MFLFVPDWRRLARKRSIFFSLSMPLLRGTKAGAEFYCVGAERGGVRSHVRPWTRRYGAIVPALAFSRTREIPPSGHGGYFDPAGWKTKM